MSSDFIAIDNESLLALLLLTVPSLPNGLKEIWRFKKPVSMPKTAKKLQLTTDDRTASNSVLQSLI
ncbi:MAG: hypothetical protein EAZ90_12240 [Oscillatoriales cyanobacterium]|nr:MAG: hypothetical protein EAZ94_06110 [Oscillatoriales cyanobacterium]TAE26780.1 MAG: hypothetical protein EAZ93_07025 [Oscillatoriales cyanobacterium]TAE43045.1 MAG: hypothetical protein EAZ90_12240 [Oscillatoriales cyanobacterium]TAE70135.1 MAG: hypothetical protein EAZ86_08000 [Oscillatoriales cyanobacterium]TAF91426.1 MAG: hypothetical protein EAZ49_05800 [Oscillatoriales cyanobacterium]